MIQNDQQLEVVREQLATAESALDSLRREVRPQSAAMYTVMAEAYVDMILSLRAQIDAYVGIVAVPETADLVISLEGENVGLGQTSAGLVTRFIDTFRRGLQSAVEILESVKRPETARRRERWIEKLCDLPLVGVAPGSVKILLGEPEFESLFSDQERELLNNALDLMFKGLNWADASDDLSLQEAFAELSEETRQPLLSLISRLMPPRHGQIERVAFQRRVPNGGRQFITVSLTHASRERVRNEIARLASDTEFKELDGVIRSVDLDAQTFVLRERPENQPDLLCEYGSDLEDAVKEYLDQRVIVSGAVETSRKTQKAKMSADNIELSGSDDLEGSGERRAEQDADAEMPK